MGGRPQIRRYLFGFAGVGAALAAWSGGAQLSRLGGAGEAPPPPTASRSASATLARGRGGSRWVVGTSNGEIKSSVGDPAAYDQDRAAYSAIDTRQMGLTSRDFGLDLHMMALPRVVDLANRELSPPRPSEWQDLADLLADRFSPPGGDSEPSAEDFPSLIVAYIEEPDNGVDPYLDLWNQDYVGESSSELSFSLLDQIEAAMPEAEGQVLNPDAIVLQEIDNWAQVPHSRDPARVPSSSVGGFLEGIHGMSAGLPPETRPVEAWAYLSEQGALMVGLESWALGDEAAAPGEPRAYLTTDPDRDEVGFQFQASCPARAAAFSLSFLHCDRNGADGGGDAADGAAREDLRLHVYVYNRTQGQWIEVGSKDPRYYTADAYGGFRFYDPDREEGVELIDTGNILSSVTCDGASFPIRVVARCHAADGVCDGCRSGEAACSATQGEGAGEGTNHGYVADVHVKRAVSARAGVGRFATSDVLIDLSEGVTAILDDPAFLSGPNTGYRFLDTAGSPALDSVIVRYGHGQLGECARSEEERSRCDAAQARLMKAIGAAVGSGASNRSLGYFQAQSWLNGWDARWLVAMLKNAEQLTDGVIGGDYPLAYWPLAQSAATYGEFAERAGIRPDLDANLTSFDPADDYSLFFYYPVDRKRDAVPGWYQRYTADLDLDAPGSGAPAELSFELAQWGCTGCGVIENADDPDLAAETPDMILEFARARTDVDPAESSAEVFVMEADNLSFYRVRGDGSGSAEEWRATEGTWELEVTLYSVDTPAAARHGFFRLIDADPASPTYGDTYEVPTGWSYSAGVWTEEGANYLPLSLPLGYYNDSVLPEAAAQFLDVEGCLWAFWTDGASEPSAGSWEAACEAGLQLSAAPSGATWAAVAGMAPSVHSKSYH